MNTESIGSRHICLGDAIHTMIENLRMNKSTLLLCLVICALSATMCRGATEQAPARPLTLNECIELALANQVDIAIARNNVAIAKGRATEAASDYLPKASIQNNAFHFGSGDVLTRVTNGTALTVTQNIYDGGIREANHQASRYGVKASEAVMARTVQSVAFTVTRAYYEVLRARRLAEVADSSVAYNEELRNQVKTRAEMGAAAKVDVLPVEAQLASAVVSQLSTRNAVRTSALSLQSAIGLAPSADFDVQESDGSSLPDPASLEKQIADAVSHRPDLVQAEAQSGVARASVRAAKTSLYPRPVITGEYQHSISGGFGSSGTQVVGGIAFDVFDGGANRAAYRQARAEQANTEAQASQLVKDIQVEVEQARLNLTSAKERIAASELGLKAAQTNYDVQKDRYNQGLAITLDLLNAELQVTTAKTNDVQARYDYYTAIAQMEYALGVGGRER